jgi:hypothetical protein
MCLFSCEHAWEHSCPHSNLLAWRMYVWAAFWLGLYDSIILLLQTNICHVYDIFYTHALKELEFARSILQSILLFLKLITFVDSEYSSPPLNQYVVTKQMYFNSTHFRYAVYRTFMQNDMWNNRLVFQYLCFYNSFPGHYSRILLKCDAIQWKLMA